MVRIEANRQTSEWGGNLYGLFTEYDVFVLYRLRVYPHLLLFFFQRKK
jgi:hypothetical protein